MDDSGDCGGLFVTELGTDFEQHAVLAGVARHKRRRRQAQTKAVLPVPKWNLKNECRITRSPRASFHSTAEAPRTPGWTRNQ